MTQPSTPPSLDQLVTLLASARHAHAATQATATAARKAWKDLLVSAGISPGAPAPVTSVPASLGAQLGALGTALAAAELDERQKKAAMDAAGADHLAELVRRGAA